MPKRLRYFATLLLGVLVIGVSSSSAAPPAAPSWVLRGAYSPSIDPANFVRTVDNRYFPLKVGTAFHFMGAREAATQTDDMVVTGQTKRVLGVAARSSATRSRSTGSPIERTFDWYAQDKQGNVWYMGEDSLERKNGRFVRASDSWQAGVNGAKPGIIMQGDPQPGDVYRQEYYRPGGALDQARVLGLDGQGQGPLRSVHTSPRDRRVEPGGAADSRRSTTTPASVRSRSGSCRAATSSSSS